MDKNWFKKRLKYFIILALNAVIVVLLCFKSTRQVLYGLFGYAIYAYIAAITIACVFWIMGRAVEIKKTRALLYFGLFLSFLLTLHVGLTKSMMGGFSQYIVGTFEVGTPGGILIALVSSVLAVPLGYLPSLIVFFVLTAGLGLAALFPLLVMQEKGKKSPSKIRKVMEPAPAPREPKLLNEPWADASTALYPTSILEDVSEKRTGETVVGRGEDSAYSVLFAAGAAEEKLSPKEKEKKDEPRPSLIPEAIPEKSSIKTDYYTQNSFIEKRNLAYDKLSTDPDTYYKMKYAEEQSAASQPARGAGRNSEPVFTERVAYPAAQFEQKDDSESRAPEAYHPEYLDVDEVQEVPPKSNVRYESTRRAESVSQMEERRESPKTVAKTEPQRLQRTFVQRPYMAPPIDLLDPDTDISSGEIEDYGSRKEIIEETIRDFGIEGTVVNAIKGPAVTRYEIKLAPTTNVKKINGVKDNLMMNLAVASLTILAPIKGKPLVGVEVPNIKRSKVSFRAMMNTPEFNKKEGKVVFAIGKTVDNRSYAFDLVDAPHMMVAGTTGSGKSVCINTIIMSLLYRYSPEDMRFIMIDPKRVELTPYKEIPHMLIKNPIIEVQQAINVLKWACDEMDRRYEFLNLNGTKDIDSYNKNVRRENEPKMFRIIIFIDEMADLMMRAKGQVEMSVVRIAQLGRAAGIHLILATQRPSASIITGLIKANISTCITFTTKTNLESRIIMDDGGAEYLLGKGDLYFTTPKETDKVRMQGAFVDEPEIKRVCDYVRQHNEAHFDDSIESAVAVQTPVDTDDAAEKVSGAEESEKSMNALLKNVMRTFIIMQRASVSLAQMKHAIGYLKASRVVNKLEELGCITAEDGKISRKVLISLEELDKIFPPEDGEEKDYE